MFVVSSLPDVKQEVSWKWQVNQPAHTHIGGKEKLIGLFIVKLRRVTA
jgi:hypothetical protein